MKTLLDTLILQASSILLGKRDVVRLSIACLLARGHLLIEDVPGVGKTTLAHALAHLLGLSYRRIQFTSDLLPSDVTGVSIFERNSGEFRFHPGPIFSQVLLADEINRATPKAQSALLEAMEERQVSVEGETHPLPTPFFVIATQNPGYQIGTYPLPESQLDRFLMRISIGFPNAEAERSLLKGEDRRQLLARFGPVFSPKQLLDLQKEVDQIHASEAIYDYCQALLTFTRSSSRFSTGATLSSRKMFRQYCLLSPVIVFRVVREIAAMGWGWPSTFLNLSRFHDQKPWQFFPCGSPPSRWHYHH